MIKLVSVYQTKGAITKLYELLRERTPEQSISHRRMPTIAEHRAFFHSKPYLAWNFILNEYDEIVGSIYLSKQREIGVFVFRIWHQYGYATQAVKQMMQDWPGKFLANVNPENYASIKFFEQFGAKHIQNTYEFS